MKDLAFYLHVPFCLKKCAYCSFYSLPGRHKHQRYLAAVRRQICQLSASRPLTTVFFGGGTPSMLPPEDLSNLLALCRQQFGCCEDAEISIEVNPATVDLSALQALKQAGFNRLSIGAQSFHEQELRTLGRSHRAADAVQTVCLASKAGFSNISLDLMYGLPGQTLASWQATLEQVLQLAPQHLSVYELTIEEGTPFALQQQCGTLAALPDEETVLRLLEETLARLGQAGFHRYEISNYARPGFVCRHNINYWRNGDWLASGPSAVSSINGIRYTAIADLEAYCRCLENGQEPWQEQERLTREAAFRETVVIGLRMTAGVSLPDLRCRFDIDATSYYGPTLERLVRFGLLEIVKEHLRLTEQGLLLADTVMAELV